MLRSAGRAAPVTRHGRPAYYAICGSQPIDEVASSCAITVAGAERTSDT